VHDTYWDTCRSAVRIASAMALHSRTCHDGAQVDSCSERGSQSSSDLWPLVVLGGVVQVLERCEEACVDLGMEYAAVRAVVEEALTAPKGPRPLPVVAVQSSAALARRSTEGVPFEAIEAVVSGLAGGGWPGLLWGLSVRLVWLIPGLCGVGLCLLAKGVGRSKG
jgi:hypothetical protein